MIYNDSSLVRNYLTPYRYPVPVLHGSGIEGHFDSKGVDIPFVFKHNGKYFMAYTGFDGVGYQSALAVSEDLFHWKHYCMIFVRDNKQSSWDSGGGAVTWFIKKDDKLTETPTLKKIDGRYWFVYHAYPGTGYENGAAQIGLAWCDKEDLTEWNRFEMPVFSWKDGGEWEHGGLYKACIITGQKKKWVMFYNAKNRKEKWNEQIGMAASDDLLHWRRYTGNPVLTNGSWDSTFTSDPYVVYDSGKWLMFYYGIGRMDNSDYFYHAEDGLAFSDDLEHWEKVLNPILVHGKPRDYDNHHAHKPAIFYENGVLFHFYCGTCAASAKYTTELFGEYRTICVAASRKIW